LKMWGVADEPPRLAAIPHICLLLPLLPTKAIWGLWEDVGGSLVGKLINPISLLPKTASLQPPVDGLVCGSLVGARLLVNGDDVGPLNQAVLSSGKH